MSTNDNITIEISTADVNLTSEMDVQPTPTSQIDEVNTPVSVVSVETEKVATSMSTGSEGKPDGTAALMQLLLNKFDEKFTNLNDKFDKQFNELKNEIKISNDNLIKQCDKVIKKLDENLLQLENQKVSGSEHSTKNEVLINKVNNNDNVNNEFTGSKNMIL